MANHPLPTMLAAGILATINSDDPAYFGGYLNANYRAVSDILDNDRQKLVKLAENSFKASFLDLPQKEQLLSELKIYADENLQ